MQCEVLQQLADNNFLECCLDIFVEFCNAKEYKESFEPNVCLSVLERRSELEVRAQKCVSVRVRPSAARARPRPPSAALLCAAADVLHNVSAFSRTRLTQWNDRGLYRLLFRCASWCKGPLEEVTRVRACVCRALYAVSSHKCVRSTLATTKDCLHSLVATLKPFVGDEVNASSVQAHTQALLLVASLLSDSAAADSVWGQLKESPTPALLHLLCQCLHMDEIDLLEAALYCLTQLAQSTRTKRHVDQTKDGSWIQFYDSILSPFVDNHSARDKHDCQPEYMAEEMCKALINLYQKSTPDVKKYQASQDDHWISVCSCLSSILSVSPRSRNYAVHRHLSTMLMETLQATRDHLSMQGKPADIIRNANHEPVLRTLYWLLTIIDCSMVDCPSAKESFVDEGIAVSLIRLWPWCMLTEQLRKTVLHLLYTFTNDCHKAWSAMCACAGGRSACGLLCDLAARLAAAASLASHASHSLLSLALAILRHCTPHQHCRSIIVKSEVLSSAYKCCVRMRAGAGAGAGAGASLCGACARLAEALARRGDGAGAALALLPPRAPPAPPALRTALLPALAHAAHYHRALFLQSPDLLELLSGSLLAGDTTDIVCAARAVWALAANNHKAKLLLRSAGVTSAVDSALHRLEREREPAAQRALQLLTYTRTVLQAS